jgi:putative chitobiose transport system substrate-binding protein
MRRVIAAWEQDHPGVTVRWTDVPWGSVERKLLAAVFARTAPDLVNLNPNFAANLASKGGLRDLTPLLPAAAADRYLAGIWTSGQQQGEQFGIPWYLTARVTIANRRLLERAGLTAPPRRWEEVPAYAEAVRRRTGRYALFVTVVPDDSGELMESLVQMGVRLLDDRQRAAFNSPAGRHALDGTATQISYGFWVVSRWNRRAERRQMTPRGTCRATAANW